MASRCGSMQAPMLPMPEVRSQIAIILSSSWHMGGEVAHLRADWGWEAHQHVGQLAADHFGAEQLPQLGERDQPLHRPGRPVVISPVADPEDLVAGLSRLVEQLTYFGAALVPSWRPPLDRL
jgi:hypothetical protein